MSNVLILGANGNLGQAFRKLYKEQATYYDRTELDITDQAAVQKTLQDLKPEVVINCAAYNAVDKAEQEAELATKINGDAPGYLAQTCKEISATLVHFSTHYVFSGEKETGYVETDTPNAKSQYAISKALGERNVTANTTDYYIIRTAWLYGKNPLGGKKSFVDIMLEKAATTNSLQVVEDEIAHPTYVKDLAEATKELLETKAEFGIYHITNSGMASWYDWAREIFTIKGIDISITPVPATTFPRPVMRPHFGIIHNTKLAPLRNWKDALREYLNSKP